MLLEMSSFRFVSRNVITEVVRKKQSGRARAKSLHVIVLADLRDIALFILHTSRDHFDGLQT